jgi:hypothetical protein
MHAFAATGCRFTAKATNACAPAKDMDYPVFQWELAKTMEKREALFRNQNRIHLVYDHMFYTSLGCEENPMVDVSTLRDAMNQIGANDLLQVGFYPEGKHPVDMIFGIYQPPNPAIIPSYSLSANKSAFTAKQARHKIAGKMHETGLVILVMWSLLDEDETLSGKWRPRPCGYISRLVNPSKLQREFSNLGTRACNSISACQAPLKYPLPAQHKGHGKNTVDQIPAGSIRFLQEIPSLSNSLEGKGGAYRGMGFGKRVMRSGMYIFNLTFLAKQSYTQ